MIVLKTSSHSFPALNPNEKHSFLPLSAKANLQASVVNVNFVGPFSVKNQKCLSNDPLVDSSKSSDLVVIAIH
jgi:hypothetical protein